MLQPTQIDALLKLKSYLRCKVCLGIFQDPCSLSCAHNFCRVCVEEELYKKSVCPDCGIPAYPKDIKKNPTLDGIVAGFAELRQTFESADEMMCLGGTLSQTDAPSSQKLPGSQEEHIMGTENSTGSGREDVKARNVATPTLPLKTTIALSQAPTGGIAPHSSSSPCPSFEGESADCPSSSKNQPPKGMLSIGGAFSQIDATASQTLQRPHTTHSMDTETGLASGTKEDGHKKNAGTPASPCQSAISLSQAPTEVTTPQSNSVDPKSQVPCPPLDRESANCSSPRQKEPPEGMPGLAPCAVRVFETRSLSPTQVTSPLRVKQNNTDEEAKTHLFGEQDFGQKSQNISQPSKLSPTQVTTPVILNRNSRSPALTQTEEDPSQKEELEAGSQSSNVSPTQVTTPNFVGELGDKRVTTEAGFEKEPIKKSQECRVSDGWFTKTGGSTQDKWMTRRSPGTKTRVRKRKTQVHPKISSIFSSRQHESDELGDSLTKSRNSRFSQSHGSDKEGDYKPPRNDEGAESQDGDVEGYESDMQEQPNYRQIESSPLRNKVAMEVDHSQPSMNPACRLLNGPIDDSKTEDAMPDKDYDPWADNDDVEASPEIVKPSSANADDQRPQMELEFSQSESTKIMTEASPHMGNVPPQDGEASPFVQKQGLVLQDKRVTEALSNTSKHTTPSESHAAKNAGARVPSGFLVSRKKDDWLDQPYIKLHDGKAGQGPSLTQETQTEGASDQSANATQTFEEDSTALENKGAEHAQHPGRVICAETQADIVEQTGLCMNDSPVGINCRVESSQMENASQDSLESQLRPEDSTSLSMAKAGGSLICLETPKNHGHRQKDIRDECLNESANPMVPDTPLGEGLSGESEVPESQWASEIPSSQIVNKKGFVPDSQGVSNESVAESLQEPIPSEQLIPCRWTRLQEKSDYHINSNQQQMSSLQPPSQKNQSSSSFDENPDPNEFAWNSSSNSLHKSQRDQEIETLTPLPPPFHGALGHDSSNKGDAKSQENREQELEAQPHKRNSLANLSVPLISSQHQSNDMSTLQMSDDIRISSDSLSLEKIDTQELKLLAQKGKSDEVRLKQIEARLQAQEAIKAFPNQAQDQVKETIRTNLDHGQNAQPQDCEIQQENEWNESQKKAFLRDETGGSQQEESQPLVSCHESHENVQESQQENVGTPSSASAAHMNMEAKQSNSGVMDEVQETGILTEEQTLKSATIKAGGVQNMEETERPVLSVTLDKLSEAERKVLDEVVALNMCRIALTVTDEGVTHFVFEEATLSKDNRIEHLRRLAYAKALCLGLWVVSFGWIKSSLQEKAWLPPEDYEVQGRVADSMLQAPRRWRVHSLQNKPKLLHDHQVMLSISDRDKVLTFGELISLSGAKYVGAIDILNQTKHVEPWILGSLDKNRTTVILLTHADKKHKVQIESFASKLLPVKVSLVLQRWLTDTIFNFQIQPFSKYRFN